MWVYSIVVSSKPYLRAFVPEHPNANKHGYVAEHRIVMENHLGRLLSASEVVHHVNEDTTDNRVENLLVLHKSAHTKLHKEGTGHGALTLTCMECGRLFEREFNQRPSAKGYANTFCSLSCGAKYTGKRISHSRNPRHGTVTEYRHHKCRCALCKEAQRVSIREYKQSKTA